MNVKSKSFLIAGLAALGLIAAAAAHVSLTSNAAPRGNDCRVITSDNGDKSTVCTRRFGTCDQYDLKTGYCARQAITVDHRKENSIFQDGKGGDSGSN